MCTDTIHNIPNIANNNNIDCIKKKVKTVYYKQISMLNDFISLSIGKVIVSERLQTESKGSESVVWRSVHHQLFSSR